MLAWTLGIIGGLCAIMGIIVAVEAYSLTLGISALNEWEFWLIISGVLFLATIAVTVGHRQGYE
jgi:hypothetical protein